MKSITFDFRHWRRKICGVTQQEAARRLELTRTSVVEMERGRDYRGKARPVRKVVRLACAAILLGVDDFDGHQITFAKPQKAKD